MNGQGAIGLKGDGIRIERMAFSSFDKWFLGIIKEAKGKGMESVLNDVAYVCWNIWKDRCDRVIGWWIARWLLTKLRLP